MSPCYRFAQYLRKLKQTHIRCSFEEIESILQRQLPLSARKYTAYWSNSNSHSLMKVVLDEGWRKKELDIKMEYVTFEKVSTKNDMHETLNSRDNNLRNDVEKTIPSGLSDEMPLAMKNLLNDAFFLFGRLLERRVHFEIFTTEDSVRYLFFHCLVRQFGLDPNEILLETPHPDDQRKQIDMIATLDPEIVCEFKFHRNTSADNSPRTMKAGMMFNDIFRLARYHRQKKNSVCLFVYVTDKEMKSHLENNFRSFFNLNQSDDIVINERYLENMSPTFRKQIDKISDCTVRSIFAKNHDLSIRIFQVFSTIS